MGGFVYVVACQKKGTISCGLFRTNGTTALSPVKLHSGVDNVIVLGATSSHVFYEVEEDLPSRFSVWSTDGTEAGTQQVGSSATEQFRVVGGEAVWYEYSPTSAWRRSNGTPAGTSSLPTSSDEDAPSTAGAFTAGDRAIYVAHGVLTMSNGTEADTVAISQDKFSNIDDYRFVPGVWVGATNFFRVERPTGEDADYVTELWRTDGTDAGTLLLHTFPSSSDNVPMITDGTRAYVSEGRPWVTDGTVAGTRVLKGSVKITNSSASGYGPPVLVDGQVRIPMQIPDKFGGWDPEAVVMFGTVNGATATVADGPIYRVDPTLGARVGNFQIIPLAEYSTVDGYDAARWYSYDATKPFVGQPSKVYARAPKTVRLGRTLKMTVGIRSQLLPYHRKARLVVMLGKRVLVKEKVRNRLTFNIAIPTRKLGKGTKKLKVQYLGTWRVASSPVVTKTVTIQ